MLPQVTYIDDLHRNLIFPAPEVDELDELEDDSLKAFEESSFIIQKFTGFSQFGLIELEKLAKEALDQMETEDDELMIIKKQVRRHERKNEAFEKETFDLFDDYIDTDIENEPEESTNTDSVKKWMFKS
jgi:hypothetical protein